MKKVLILSITFYLVFLSSNLNAQGWQWGFRSYTGLNWTSYTYDNADLYAGSSTVDNAGNLFVASTNVYGYYCILGPVTIFNDTGYYQQLVISKQDTTGNIVFAVGTSQHSDATAVSIATSTSGYLYVLGYYNTKLHMDTVTLLNTDSGTTKCFIMKINPSGHPIWAKNLITSPDYWAYSKLCIDGAGNITATGIYNEKLQIVGSDTLYNADTSGVGSDIFIIKLDSLGNTIWAKSYGGCFSDYSMSLALDKNDNIYMSGRYYSDTLILGIDTFYNNSGDTTINTYVAKFDAYGNTIWIKNITADIYFTSMAVDDNGSVYMVGSSQQDSITIGPYTLYNPQSVGAIYVIAKYDSSGNTKWAKSGGGSNNYGSSISIDNCEKVWVSGSGIVPNFDGHIPYYQTASFYPIFIVEYDTAGNYIYNTTLPTGGDGSVGINVDNKGSFYVSGSYNYFSLIFGNDTLHPDSSTHSAFELYTAKFTYDSFQCHQYNLPTQIETINAPLPEIIIYPNPTHDKINISYSSNIFTVAITNLVGQYIYTQQYNNLKVQVDVSYLPAGIYFVNVNGLEVRKFVKE